MEFDLRNKQPIIDFLINNNEEEYYKKKVEFTFAGKRYKTSIQFAYFNGELDYILNKYNIRHDASWMMLKAFTRKNYDSFLDQIIQNLYDFNYNDDPQKIILEILTLTNEMINYFNSGAKVSQNFSLTRIMNDAIDDERLYQLLFENRIDPKWTPEKIIEHRKQNKEDIKNNVYLSGVTELLTSGYGVKEEQMVNIYTGIDLIPRIHNMKEIFPRPVDTDWLWGLQNKDQFFMTANINVFALYMSKTVIQRSGVINKMAAMIAQDTTITEHDCGTKTFVEYYVADEKTLKTLRFKYMVKDDGTLEEITLDHKHLIGKRIKVRSAYTCCAKHDQICEVCFGANARWNKSTDEYRIDLGAASTKEEITGIAQDVISTKHQVAPNLIPLEMWIVSNGKKKKKLPDLENNDIFKREFNRFIFKEGVEVFIYKEDCTNEVYLPGKEKKKKKELTPEEKMSRSLTYMDNEFGEYDIIRVNKLRIKTFDVEFILKANSEFRISGFDTRTFLSLPDNEPIKIDLINQAITHVIRNEAKALKFYDVEDLYRLATPNNTQLSKMKDNEDGWDDDNDEHLVRDYIDFIQKVNECFPYVPKVRTEIVFRNKIRDANNPHKRPDWKSGNPEAIVLSRDKTIAARPSLSLKIAAGRINQRLNDPFYHDVRNLMNTSYDRIYDDLDIEEDTDNDNED